MREAVYSYYSRLCEVETNEIVDNLAKGWPGYLAIGYFVVRDAGPMAWNFFIKRQENEAKIEEKYQDLSLKIIERGIEESTRITQEFTELKHKVFSIEQQNKSQVEAIRAIVSELGLVNTKLNEVLKALIKKKEAKQQL